MHKIYLSKHVWNDLGFEEGMSVDLYWYHFVDFGLQLIRWTDGKQ